jgi:hypothetical protein
MTLNSSGPISLGGSTAGQSVNLELGYAATATITMNDTAVRTLAGFPTSGSSYSMSNFYGKSNIVNISYTFTSNTASASLNVSGISGYVSGKSNITVTINGGVYLYGPGGNFNGTVTTPGFALSGGTSGDTITLNNNGYIAGGGGRGGDATGGYNAGPGLSVTTGVAVSIANAGYIGGGGGGAGGGFNNHAGGGGGAGGGQGGGATAGGQGGGGAGGGPGAYGCNGYCYLYYCGTGWGGGGGGGRIFPGSGGAGGSLSYCPCYGYSGHPAGYGGGAGGGGGGCGGVGGSANNAGDPIYAGGGGGGGWGAYGGGYPPRYGGAGGYAISKNGVTVTFISGCSRVYGSIV